MHSREANQKNHQEPQKLVFSYHKRHSLAQQSNKCIAINFRKYLQFLTLSSGVFWDPGEIAPPVIQQARHIFLRSSPILFQKLFSYSEYYGNINQRQY